MNPERWRQIEKLYYAALEKTGERTSFLAEACAGDEGLLREVETLLQAHECEDSFLTAPALEVVAQGVAQAQVRSLVGRSLAHYQILSSLGTGGMGEVYHARDLRLGRELAIKVLSETFAGDRGAMERFEQEARSASALNHPNIITIYDIGRIESVSYIAMEYVDGLSLRQMLLEGPIAIKKLLALAVQLADGLAAAHSRGIVHRDLKPENIMVSTDALVKIVDFGLAKRELTALLREVSTISSTGESATQVGTILGTIGYMSPQQARGEVLDFRSDQFSFGAVLYEMATGERAFQRNTGVETLAAIIRDEPPPIGQVNPLVPPPLVWTIERCLAKDPHNRYASTLNLARDLAVVRDRMAEVPLQIRSTPAHNLPVQRTRLIARDQEVASAKQLLLRENVRLVTLTGPAGTGKTRLALEVAAEVVEYFDGGIHFLPLASITDPDVLASTIARALGIRQTQGQPLVQSLKEQLWASQDAATLLLLDNFEQILIAAPLVAELLGGWPGLKVMVTSRAVLHVYGEHEFRVQAMTVPHLKSLPSLEVLSGNPAVALFIERARAVKPDFALTKDNAASVAEICARLDGLPLAIELAAARIKLLPPAAMLARMQSRLQVLTGGPRDLPARQQTLRAALDWSYNLLTEAEQKLFRRLSVFGGGCTLEAVEAVCNTRSDLEVDVLEAVGSLLDKSLLQQVGEAEGEARFKMLETIREYGLECLSESGEEPATRRSHAAYCLVLAEEGVEPELGVSESISGPRHSTSSYGVSSAWLDRCTVEEDNLRAAIEWLTQEGDAEWGLRLTAALVRFWEQRENFVEGYKHIMRLLELGGATVSMKLRGRALFAAATMSTLLGNCRSACLLHEEGLKIYRILEDNWGVIASLNCLALLAQWQGDYETARSLFEENLANCQKLGDSVAIAVSLSNLATVFKAQGNQEAARSFYEQSLAMLRTLGDRRGVASLLNHLGDLARDKHDHARARCLYEEALAIFRELGDQWGMASSLTDLGDLARSKGDHTSARSFYEQSVVMFRGLGHKRGVARLLDGFACCAADEGMWERVLKLAGAAAALRKALGSLLGPSGKMNVEDNLEPARQALSSAAAASAWMEGWGMPLEQAVEYALGRDVP